MRSEIVQEQLKWRMGELSEIHRRKEGLGAVWGWPEDTLTAEAAVSPDRRLDPLGLAGGPEGLQRLAEGMVEVSKLTEAVGTSEQEGTENHVGGTLRPGWSLKSRLALLLGSCQVSCPAVCIWLLLRFCFSLLVIFLATGKAKGVILGTATASSMIMTWRSQTTLKTPPVFTGKLAWALASLPRGLSLLPRFEAKTGRLSRFPI